MLQNQEIQSLDSIGLFPVRSLFQVHFFGFFELAVKAWGFEEV